MLRSPTPKLPENTLQRARNTLRTPSPKKPARLPLPMEKEKTPEAPPKFALRSRKENSPMSIRSTLTERAVNRKSSEVVITSLSPQKKKEIPSLISSPRPKLQERPLPKPNMSPKKNTTISPQKTRIANREKTTRERVESEKQLLVSTQTSLQSELDALSKDLSTSSAGHADPTLIPTTLSAHLTTLQSKIDTTFSTLDARLTTLEASIPPQSSQNDSTPSTTTTQRISSLESKNANLAALYKETNAENEALYDRFNEELAKVLALIKGGKGEE